MKLITTLVLCLISSLAIAAERWVLVARAVDNSFSLYVDDNSFKHVDEVLQFELLSDNRDAPHTAKWQVNCRSSTAVMTQIRYLDATGSITKVITGRMSVPIGPGEMAFFVVKYVCSKSFI